MPSVCPKTAGAIRGKPEAPARGQVDAHCMGAVFEELLAPLSDGEALLEADRCLECGGEAGAPCVAGCPADVDVPAFVAAIAAGDPAAAAKVIFAANLLGGTCARVCPVEELCARECVLLHEGREAIPIGRLQRYATDWAFHHVLRPRTRAAQSGRHIAVIGAGPAGLATAGELAALGHDVTVYDEHAEPGGLVRYAIAPYRQQREPIPDEVRMLGELGVKLRLRTTVDEQLLRELHETTDAIVLAVGLGGDSDVRYPGDEFDGVWDSLDFIEAIKTGATINPGTRAIVVGGGNTAIDCAVELRRLGADKVTMLYRRTEAEMPAYAHEVELARAEGVTFEWLAAPVRLLGDVRVRAVEVRRMELGPPDSSSRRRPVEVPGSEFVMLADTVVKAIGRRPRDAFLSLLGGLERDDDCIVVDEYGRTTVRGVYAAGDAVNGGTTVVEAVRLAKRVAAAVHEELT
jgi:dihydropyrimidine dehydrogenase (NAD+) subunit PreT